jgi:ABC-type Fe3+-hydroxamate transport system substrate-binding protein
VIAEDPPQFSSTTFSYLAFMKILTDQIGRKISVPHNPKRIISLVPSQTELLYELGLEDEVVGITKFCVHPINWFRTKTRIGGTKNVNLDKIRSLQPDLILANKEENVEEHILELEKEFPVWTSDVNNLEDAYDMITAIGTMTDKADKASLMINDIKERFFQLEKAVNGNGPPIKTCYLIWKDPYLTAGGDTFINDMMQRAGFENIFSQRSRYPEIKIDELQGSGCQLLMLSSEPYPFTQKHLDELKQLLSQTRIILADGEMFSWYGSRLLKAPGYFKDLQVASIS